MASEAFLFQGFWDYSSFEKLTSGAKARFLLSSLRHG
jgi:hypothetical protein